MRHLWFNLLLALGARGVRPLPRGLSEPDLVARWLDERQVVSVTSSPLVTPTLPLASTTSVGSDPALVTTSIVAPLTTNLVATTNSVSVPTTSSVLTTTDPSTPTTTSSIPLLYTQTSTSSSASSRSSSSAANTSTPAPVTDINVPFSQSKYHQMIIALGCFAVGLLVAFIVTVIVALRAKADVDLLRDRINRYEEQMYMNQQKDRSPYELGSTASRSFGQQTYGRVSTNDPDETLGLRPRRSMSEGQGQFGTLPYAKTGQGTAAKGRPQPGNRRVTFSDEGHRSDALPLLSTTTSRDTVPQYSQTHPLAPPPKSTGQYDSPALVQSPPQLSSSPPPQSGFVSTPFAPPLSHPPSLQPGMSDPGRVTTPPIRRLPATPGASANIENSGYADPFGTGHGRSTNGGPPRY
ncbi:hypothetical protein RSOLAG22IIIB_06291 [Rhizoctonia solani]|uniref:Uncharacterized protein n=1 Tax=Rhizoctonia solani TaxID=456999 RepID=A0A0K6GD18_9AGAM|nr:unnamed protein product [Rhizoctonia solani]CUA76487.1 hypothetical protein RSOLAG22IIIB_06291 [Rhizoctonia solani]